MEQTAIVRIRLDDAGLPQAAKRAGDSLAGIGKAGEVSARQTAAAMRQLPAQFTDVATQLAGGGNPLLVLLQQGGQIKDSFGGIGPAIKGVASAINPLTVGVGAVAAVVGGLGLAANAASKEAFELEKAVLLNGATAGLTTAQMARLTRVLDELPGVTRGKATKALVEISAASAASAHDLALLTTAALNLERAGAQSIGETAKAFERLRRDPLQATKEYGAQLGYLNAGLYEQVRALVEQGRTLDAASVAQRAYAEAGDQVAKKLEASLSPLQRAWKSLTETAGKAWDAMVGLGRDTTALERFAQIQAQIERNQAGGTRRGSAPRTGLAALGQADLEAERGAVNRTLVNDAEAGMARSQAIERAQQYARAREEFDKWAQQGATASERL
ncbi:MAG: phage tail length tape measure family protein, partial [Burkholderiaceae bacterium]|nr:phage tail length tape measure family protein [Burkholderiaceae bacterium]